MPGGMATLEHVALKTAPSEAIVGAVAAAFQRVYGRAGEFGAFPAWTDGALLSAFGGIPTLILGPGDLAVARLARGVGRDRTGHRGRTHLRPHRDGVLRSYDMKLRVPHTFALLFGLVVLAAVATHFIPAGTFDRVELQGREVVEPDPSRSCRSLPGGGYGGLSGLPQGSPGNRPHRVLHLSHRRRLQRGQRHRRHRGHDPRRRPRLPGYAQVVIAVLVVLFCSAAPPSAWPRKRLSSSARPGGAGQSIGLRQHHRRRHRAGRRRRRFRRAYSLTRSRSAWRRTSPVCRSSGYIGFRLVVAVVLTAITVVYIVLWSRRRRAEPATGGLPLDSGDSTPLGLRKWSVLLGAPRRVGGGRGRRHELGLGILELSGLFTGVAILAGLLGGLGANGTAERFVEAPPPSPAARWWSVSPAACS